MSFILDAIARSEAERKQRDVPSADLLAFPLERPPPRRRAWPYLVAGAALMVNGLLLYLLLQGDRPAVDTAPVDTAAVDGAAVDSPTIDSPTIDSPTIDSPTVGTAAAAAAAIESAPVAKPDAVTTAKRRTGLPRAPAAPVASEDPTAGDAVVAAPPAGAEDAGWLRVRPDSLARAVDAAGQAAEARPGSPSTALFNRVVRPSELPDALRSELPKVTFSGHLYSSNPRSSLVFVGNGRPVVTGQAIERDLMLHEITPTGVVVEFRGYLIEVGVLQNWTLN